MRGLIDYAVLALDWVMARLPLPECALDFSVSEAAIRARKRIKDRA